MVSAARARILRVSARVPIVLFNKRRFSTLAMPTPTTVEVDTTAQTLTVEWSDGHTAVFPLNALRGACPCATCQGGDVERIDPPRLRDLFRITERRWTDVTVEQAGSVGIRITWDDGHNAGVYRWDRLRALQPPDEA
jgi:DUF971 family protein